MSSVIIRDEGERRALEAALWHAMRPILDPNDMSPIGEAIFDAAEAVTRRRDAVDLSALAAEVDEAIGAVLALRASIDRLRTSDLGDAIEAGVSEESLVTRPRRPCRNVLRNTLAAHTLMAGSGTRTQPFVSSW